MDPLVDHMHGTFALYGNNAVRKQSIIDWWLDMDIIMSFIFFQVYTICVI